MLSMVRIQEINEIQELAGHRAAWDVLLSQTTDGTFFQSLDWLECYWKHFGAGQRLRVLLVSEGDRITGILPLVVTREATHVGTIGTLTYPLHDWGSFYAPIGPDPAATLRAGLRHIRQTPRDWDLMDLRWVDLKGSDQDPTEQAMRESGFKPRRQAWAKTAVIKLEGGWDAYWKGRSKKWRHNVTNCTRRMVELGELSYLRYRPAGQACNDGDPRWDLFDACVDVARRSWQGSSTSGTTLCHESVYAFLREVHGVAARCGALDVNLLKSNGKPVAFAYNYYRGQRIYGLRMGFDPAFEGSGPGTVLQRMILEDSFRRGDRHYDMGACYFTGKRPWLTEIATSYHYTHFPLNVSRVQILRMKQWLIERWYGDKYVVCAKIG
jgi:CelD/BcsL family acetyltransferase involved in cellulose biosynthesis